VKTHDILDIHDVSNKQAVFVTVVNAGGVAVAVHHIHGITPAWSRKARALHKIQIFAGR
jgi:hypothetical protein